MNPVAARYCYGGSLEITTRDVAPLRCAAALLDAPDLARRAEDFLAQAALRSLPGATDVLRSCEALLPGAGRPSSRRCLRRRSGWSRRCGATAYAERVLARILAAPGRPAAMAVAVAVACSCRCMSTAAGRQLLAVAVACGYGGQALHVGLSHMCFGRSKDGGGVECLQFDVFSLLTHMCFSQRLHGRRVG
jgi:hypothetical protein